MGGPQEQKWPWICSNSKHKGERLVFIPYKPSLINQTACNMKNVCSRILVLLQHLGNVLFAYLVPTKKYGLCHHHIMMVFFSQREWIGGWVARGEECDRE